MITLKCAIHIWTLSNINLSHLLCFTHHMCSITNLKHTYFFFSISGSKVSWQISPSSAFPPPHWTNVKQSKTKWRLSVKYSTSIFPFSYWDTQLCNPAIFSVCTEMYSLIHHCYYVCVSTHIEKLAMNQMIQKYMPKVKLLNLSLNTYLHGLIFQNCWIPRSSCCSLRLINIKADLLFSGRGVLKCINSSERKLTLLLLYCQTVHFPELPMHHHMCLL